MSDALAWAESLIREARQILAIPSDSEEDYARRTAMVKRVLARARERGLYGEQNFSGTYGRGQGFGPSEDQGWSRERYQEMWRQVKAYAKAHNIDKIPRDKIGIALGGGSGTGKTTLRREIKKVIPDFPLPDMNPSLNNYGTVDPDEFKEWGWKNGMFDHLKKAFPGVAPGEMADLVHEESSAMAKMYEHMLRQRGANTIVDKTMMGVDPETGGPLPDRKNPAQKVVNKFKKAGYVPYTIGIDAPPELSQVSAANRRRDNVLNWMATGNEDAGLGARLIDDSYLLGQGRSPDPAYQHSSTFNIARVRPQVAGSWIVPVQHTPPGYTPPPTPYTPPPGLYGAHMSNSPWKPSPDAATPRMAAYRVGGGENQPPQDYEEACEWFQQGAIDFDTLAFALKTLPPPEPLFVGRDAGERRMLCDVYAAGLDTDCIEELYAADLIDENQLCDLWDAIRENPNVDMDPDAELGF